MRRRLLRWAPIAAAALLVAAVVAYFALRDASTFAITAVDVRGTSGPDAPKVEAALRQAARERTLLNVDADGLRRAVERYPTVKAVEIDRDLPHDVTLTVVERRPVAVVRTAGRRIALAADGRLLRGATPPEDVPELAVAAARGERIEDRRGRPLVALAAAAPDALRRRAVRASLTARGLTMTMDRGPDLFFGAPTDLRAKWTAVARVLADPTAEGATYVDVRVPDRAVAGGLAPLVPPETAPGETAPPLDGTAPVPGATTPVVPPEPTVPAPESTVPPTAEPSAGQPSTSPGA
jgi:cell division protein FtsQ